jgi:MYXO-CTERM domain-containing protein
MLLSLAACIGQQTVPSDSGGPAGFADPTDSGAPLDSAEDGNSSPSADAGGDQIGTVGVVVNLDGSGSYDPDDDELSFDWQIDDAPSGSAVALSGAKKEMAQLVPDREGTWEISLVVNDGALGSDADVVTITVGTDNGKPVASAGADQSVTTGDLVTLDGTASKDPDGDPLQFAWTLVTRPGGSAAALSSASAARPTFRADVDGVYEATLTVSDGTLTSGSDKVRIVASSGGGGGGGSSSSCGCQSGQPADAAFAALAAALVAGVRVLRRR